ncbi:hypothetical protein DW748_15555, partial [Ruminococcus sp. AM28-41]
PTSKSVRFKWREHVTESYHIEEGPVDRSFTVILMYFVEGGKVRFVGAYRNVLVRFSRLP